MRIIRIHFKISEQLSKSEIFLSRTHIDRDSGFSSKIGRTPTRSGWLKSLHRHTTFSFLWPYLCLTRLNEFRFFLTYFLRTSLKFSSMQWNDYSYPWTNEWWDLVWTVSMWLAPVRPGPGPVRFLCKSAADCTWSIALELHAILVGNVADWSFHIMGSSAVFKCKNT